MIKTICLTIMMLLYVNTIAFATKSESIDSLPSLNWQAQKLEDSLRRKVSSVLNSVLELNQYAVDIDLKTKDAQDPEWNKTNNPFKMKGQPSISDSKGNSNLQDELENEDGPKASKALVKFTEPAPLESPEDYIIFNKFGLEAPLIDDFNDFRPDGKIVLNMDDGDSNLDRERKAEEVRYRRQIKDENERNKSRVSDAERIWKYNNAIDVFKNLESVKIKVRLSKGLTDSVKQVVEKYLKNTNFNLGTIKPIFTFEYVMLGSDIAAPSAGELFEKYFGYFSKFATLFGIIFGVLLMGIVGNKLISRFFELKSSDQGAQSKLINESEENEDSDDSQQSMVSSGSDDSTGAVGLNGVERFKSYSKTSQKDAVLLIKKWLGEDDKNGKQALRAIVQQMDNGDLGSIFTYLNENEKADWRKLLERPLNTTELISANEFISNQIVQSIIIPSYIDDPETYDLLLKLRPEQLVEIIKEDPVTSSFLMNALSLNFVNQVLSKCDAETRNSLIEKSVQVKQKEIFEGQAQIKSVLSRYVEEREQSPFIEKITQLIPISSPEFEDSLFKNLGLHSGRESLLEMGRKFFPASEINSLPPEFLKTILMNYPLVAKSQMLLVISEELKESFMEMFAPVGSKANDMLTLEFDNITKNELEFKKLLDRGNQVWKEFVDFTRLSIKRDKHIKNEVDIILSAWADNLVQGEAASSSSDTMRLVS